VGGGKLTARREASRVSWVVLRSWGEVVVTVALVTRRW
jgi:hypothetical protein